jgi:hypothetical protein
MAWAEAMTKRYRPGPDRTALIALIPLALVIFVLLTSGCNFEMPQTARDREEREANQRDTIRWLEQQELKRQPSEQQKK